jgi:NADH-quinone oxidoreductase subunit K
MIVPFRHIFMLSGLLFVLGMFCTLTRRNLIMILLGVEIMLNAASVAFVGAALRWQQIEGQALVIFVLAIAATEVSVGLALIVAMYRRSGSVDPDAKWPDAKWPDAKWTQVEEGND